MMNPTSASIPIPPLEYRYLIGPSRVEAFDNPGELGQAEKTATDCTRTLMVLIVSDNIRIPLSEFHWSFVRAGGPGGQNVNKVASKAVLRWKVAESPYLPPDVRARLQSQQANRVTSTGDLVLSSQRFRDQEKNRRDVVERLRDMIRRAAIPPKYRKPTRPTRASQERRLTAKKHRARTKSGRRSPKPD